MVATLAYLRRNRVQHELAELFDASPLTISRVLAAMTPLLEQVLRDWVPTVEDLDPRVQSIIDETLLPCWSRADRPDLWSGEQATTGVKVQVVCTLAGDLAWMSDPAPGKTHDAKAIRDSGLSDSEITRPIWSTKATSVWA